MGKIFYRIYVPGGNDTALVCGTAFSKEEKKTVNDLIMKRHSNVEQVGFLDVSGRHELQMAGGEFCGNAARCAAFQYLEGRAGETRILVNSEDQIRAGIYGDGRVWCGIPLREGGTSARRVMLPEGKPAVIVSLKGIAYAVINGAGVLFDLADEAFLKAYSKDLIARFFLDAEPAAGVLFCSGPQGGRLGSEDTLDMIPIVWVRDIDTLFRETACGSGSTAAAIARAWESGKDCALKVLQPSGMAIDADVRYSEGRVISAAISGDVRTGGLVYELEI